MKSRAWLSFLVLVGTSTTVAAQPYGYGPGAGPGYNGPGSAPYGASPGQPWGPSPAGPVDSSADRGPSAAMGQPDMGPAVQASGVLKEGMDKLLGYLRQGEAPNQLQVAAFLDREIAPYFDFDYMARWVAGPAYSGMTAEEKKALAAQLESDFLGALTRHLAGYEGQQVKLLGPRSGPRGSVSINVAVLRAGNYPTTLQFRMSQSDRGWKVYDVVANGQSAASYYRMRFQQMARQVGAAPR